MSLKTINLSDKEELRAEIRRWKGRAYADVRVYACSRPQEAKWPTGKGFLVPVPQLPELRRALEELAAETSPTAGR